MEESSRLEKQDRSYIGLQTLHSYWVADQTNKVDQLKKKIMLNDEYSSFTDTNIYCATKLRDKVT